MPEIQGYKRGWSHTKRRGKETSVTCSFCGKRVPKYKTFSVFRDMRINDPMLRNNMGPAARRGFSLLHTKMMACPACARHRNIVRKKR